MINYKEKILENGLRVVVGRDRSSKLAAVNMLYCVGARNENPSQTGFAHLFEHLMFKGTEQFPSFDDVVQSASGENNAFTNNDYTDFYITLPKVSIELALAIEADRMRGLRLTDEVLEMEKRVVVEEYKQRYLNQPYGDLMMLVRDMCYKDHPYRWATIGLSPDHITSATMEQVRSFYDRFYRPSNCILSISADIEEEELFEMCEFHFGGIEVSSEAEAVVIPEEREQREARRTEVERDVPATYIVIAFHIGGRTDRNFFVSDVISDLLAGGDSGRLYQHLVKEQGLLSSVNAYVTGDKDPGLFMFTGQLLPETTVEQAEAALWGEIEQLKSELADGYELEKVKNKFEANTLFGEINVMNKAMNMGFYSMVGDLALINREVEIYRGIEAEEIRSVATELFTPSRSNTLIYKAIKTEGGEA
ncbi:MAG: pitrilysin family protein [Rikenellaceae bacterium]